MGENSQNQNLENMNNDEPMDIHLIQGEQGQNNALPLEQLKAYFDDKFKEQNLKLEQKERKIGIEVTGQ